MLLFKIILAFCYILGFTLWSSALLEPSWSLRSIYTSESERKNANFFFNLSRMNIKLHSSRTHLDVYYSKHEKDTSQLDSTNA